MLPRNISPTGLCLTILSAFVLSACGSSGSSTPTAQPREPLPVPLCYASHPAEDGMIRSLRTNEWADLVLRNYREGQTVTEDCAGHTITWTATDTNCDVHEPEDEAAPRAVPIDADSVVIGRTDQPMRKVVWVITHRFANGDGFGPVALTDRDEQGVGVVGLGMMRLPTERARLRLRETGGQHILVGDGEHCPDEDANDANQDNEEASQDEENTPLCLRGARFLPLVGNNFMNPEVHNRAGSCLGPAYVYLAREQKDELENGWHRRFRLAASMEYAGGSIVIHEQVIAHDIDPRDPGRPPRLFRTSDADRVIRVSRGGMRSEGIPLFERTIRAHGSTQLPLGSASSN